MSFLFEYLSNAAEHFPDKEAVRYKKQSITYKELDCASTQLANTLIYNGVDKGDRVGLYLNKSIEAIISIYGILKAGAAYVPVDPVAPIKRVEYVFLNCRISCLITGSKKLQYLDENFLQQLGMKLVLSTDQKDVLSYGSKNIFPAWSEASHESHNQIHTKSWEDNNQLAYILYTSGSTGSPKGVMLSHKNATSFVDWAKKQFRMNEKDCIASHAPFHFDLSIFDIFATAKAGATLVIVPESQVGLGGALVKFVSDNSISVWYSVPSALIRMMEATNHSLLSSCTLRLVLFAGEVFPIKHLRNLYNLMPGVTFYNLYGPTETNVCTFYCVTQEDVTPEKIKPLPIGKACEYAKLFTIDDELKTIDPLCTTEGQLCIGGDSVMLGYWENCEKTSKALVKLSDCKSISEKVYLSGDLVSQNDDGNYLFIGRRDHMVKISGYRVELGEVESTLLSHPSVHEAAVVTTKDLNEKLKLVAWIVTHNTAVISERELIQHCSQILPRYMMPKLFKFVEEFPRTSTGKIDRRKLIINQSMEKR